MLIVQACAFCEDGDGYYRESMPSRFLATLPDVVMIDCHIHHKLFPTLAEAADILILFFVHGFEVFPLMERRRRAGKVTIFETNDLYPELPTWSLIAHHWADQDICLEHEVYIASADAIQTSTKTIADHWQGHARKTGIFPNQLENFPPPKVTWGNPIRIGWAGSQGHLADFAHAARDLEPWLKKHPELHFAIMSGDHSYELMKLPKEQYHFHNPGTIKDYNTFVSSLDIGIAPILPTAYNRCRSDVKFLEYASHGVAGIYGSPGPYDKTVRHGENGFLYRTNDELIKYIEILATDVALREKFRKAAYDYVSRERRIERHIEERLTFYKSLMREGAPPGKIDSRLLSFATVSDRYVKFSLDPVSTKFQEICAKPVTPETLAFMREVAVRDPNFLAPKQALGRYYNDIGNPTEAITYLDSALQLDSDSARTLSELGRSHLLSGKKDLVRPFLESATRCNPYFYQAWLYLIRFIKIVPQPDQKEIINKLKTLHHRSVSLSLLVTELMTPPEALQETHTQLKRFSTELDSIRQKGSQKQFVPVILRCTQPLLNTPEAEKLLRDATQLFPNSPRLLDQHIASLRALGKHRDADAQCKKALEIYHHWKNYRMEYKEESEQFKTWQVGEALGILPK